MYLGLRMGYTYVNTIRPLVSGAKEARMHFITPDIGHVPTPVRVPASPLTFSISSFQILGVPS